MSGARARLIYLGYKNGAAVLRLLPSPAGRALAGGLGLAAWATGPRRRAVVAANLRRVLGPAATPAALRRTVRRAFVNYAMYWANAARLDAADPAVLGRRVSVAHPERFQEAAARGRGLVIVLPHVGCWEAGAIWTASVGYPLTSIGEELEPPELFDWFVEMRKRAELTVLRPGGASTARLLAELRAGRAVALVADRDVLGGGLPTDFFGATTPVPTGPAVLALRTGAAVVPVAIYLEPRGRFTVSLFPELDTTRTGDFRADIARLTRDIVASFEVMIRARPEQWHIFQPQWPDDEAAANR
jgi:KDO2-lipid IV(A) lauroyltransferase